jgi:hypothetical protein
MSIYHRHRLSPETTPIPNGQSVVNSDIERDQFRACRQVPHQIGYESMMLWWSLSPV